MSRFNVSGSVGFDLDVEAETVEEAEEKAWELLEELVEESPDQLEGIHVTGVNAYKAGEGDV